LTAEGASEALADSNFDDVIHEASQVSRTYRVTGVPLFIVDDRIKLSGGQPEEVFQDVLQQVLSKDA
jgi:predicted DsbA family dithiol-disulfide isomerase